MYPDKSSCEGVCGLTHSSMHAICADGTGQQVDGKDEKKKNDNKFAGAGGRRR